MCRSCGHVFSVRSNSCACIFSLCRVCVVNGHCLAVIQLCSLYLDCQDMSTRAYNLPLIFHPFASLKWQWEQKPSAEILVNFSSLQRYSDISGNVDATFHHVLKVVNFGLLNPVSPGSWQHLCVVGNGSIMRSDLFEWNVFESLSHISESCGCSFL